MSMHSLTFYVGEDEAVTVAFYFEPASRDTLDCPGADAYAEAYEVLLSEASDYSTEQLLELANTRYLSEMIERGYDNLGGDF